MLLVDQDQAQPRQRREHRQPGAEHDVGAPGQRLHEAARARTIGKRGMQAHHVGGGEALRHALLELRRERDLRHQHQHLATLRQHVRGQAQVDLGLAAAGDAVQQPGAKARPAGEDRLDRGGLLGGERRQRAGAVRASAVLVCRRHQPAAPHQVTHSLAAIHRAHHAAPPRTGRRRQGLQQCERLAGPLRGGERFTARGADLEQRVLVGVADAVGTAQPGRQRERHHLAERRVVVARDEGDQFQPVGGQRRHAALDVMDGLEPCGVDLALLAERDDQSVAITAPEGHLHAPADIRLRGICRNVIKHLRHGDGQGDADDGHGLAEGWRKLLLRQMFARVW